MRRFDKIRRNSVRVLPHRFREKQAFDLPSNQNFFLQQVLATIIVYYSSNKNIQKLKRNLLGVAAAMRELTQALAGP